MQIHIPSTNLFMGAAAGQPSYTNKAVSDADHGIRATTFEVSKEALAAKSTSATYPPTPSPISEIGQFEANFTALLEDFSQHQQVSQDAETSLITVSNEPQAATSSDNFEPEQFEGSNFVDYNPFGFQFSIQQGHDHANYLNFDNFDTCNDTSLLTRANVYQNNAFLNDATNQSTTISLEYVNTSNTNPVSRAENFSASDNAHETAPAHTDDGQDAGNADIASYNAFIRANSSTLDDLFEENVAVQSAQNDSNVSTQSTQFQADSVPSLNQSVDANDNPLDDLFGAYNKFQDTFDGHAIPTAFDPASSNSIVFKPIAVQNVNNFSDQYDISQPTQFASPANLNTIVENVESMCYSTPGLDSDTIDGSPSSDDHVSMPATPPQVAAVLSVSVQTVHDAEAIDNESTIVEYFPKLQPALPADHQMTHELTPSPVCSDFGSEVENDTEETAHPTTGGKTSWPGKNGAPLSPTTSESDNESSATVFEDPDPEFDNDSDAEEQEEEYDEDSNDVDYDEDAFSEYDDEVNNSDSDQSSDTEPAKPIILHGGKIICPGDDEEEGHEEETEKVDVPD